MSAELRKIGEARKPSLEKEARRRRFRGTIVAEIVDDDGEQHAALMRIGMRARNERSDYADGLRARALKRELETVHVAGGNFHDGELVALRDVRELALQREHLSGFASETKIVSAAPR